MKQTHLSNSLKLIMSSLLLSGLVACGSSDDRKTSAHEDEHDHSSEITDEVTNEVANGRLFIEEEGTSKVHVYSIAEKKIIQTVDLGEGASVDALYTSPEGSYAVTIDRTNNKVNFYNSGLRMEDHGEHDHPYAEDVTKNGLQLNYTRPVHFQTFEDQSAIFFDGQGAENNPVANPVVKARFALLTDKIISSGTVPSVELATNIHGTAEPRPDHVISVARTTDGTSLPEKLEVYHFEDGKLNKEETLPTPCPALHGSASSEDYSVFACSDGVVSVKQDGESFTSTKIVNNDTISNMTCPSHSGKMRPARLGSVVANGHNDIVAFACSQPYAVDVVNNKLIDIKWTDNAELKVASYAFDAHGEHLLILDNMGTLHILHVEDGYELEKSIKVLDEVHGSGHSAPKLLVNPNNDMVYIVDGHDKKVIEIHLEEGEVESETALDFEAGAYTWFGVKDGHSEHDHEAEHDHEDEHEHAEGEEHNHAS